MTFNQNANVKTKLVIIYMQRNQTNMRHTFNTCQIEETTKHPRLRLTGTNHVLTIAN